MLARIPLAFRSFDGFDDEIRVAMEQLLRCEFPQRLEEFIHLPPDLRCLRFPDRQLARVLLVLRSGDHREGVFVWLTFAKNAWSR